MTVSILAFFLVSIPNEGVAIGFLHDLYNIGPNVVTDFNPAPTEWPDINHSTYIHPQASVIGNVHIGEAGLVSPQASVKGDESNI